MPSLRKRFVLDIHCKHKNLPFITKNAALNECNTYDDESFYISGNMNMSVDPRRTKAVLYTS